LFSYKHLKDLCVSLDVIEIRVSSNPNFLFLVSLGSRFQFSRLFLSQRCRWLTRASTSAATPTKCAATGAGVNSTAGSPRTSRGRSTHAVTVLSSRCPCCFFSKRLPGVYFLIFTTLPQSHSGSPGVHAFFYLPPISMPISRVP
jgi:hypothetical protein